MPKVSVIIPCFNQGKYLDETVNSVLAQSYDDYEIVIVNDGSTDEFTNSLLRDYRRPKTKVIQTENRGVSAARNTAIQAASGEYIFPLDGDDLIGREYLQKAVAILDENREIGIVTCLIEFIGAVNYQPVQPPFSVDEMIVRNVVGPCSSLFRKIDWERVGGFNVNMASGWEDWDFWLSLIEQGAGVYRLPEVLFFYRICENSRERSLVAEKRIAMFMQLYNNHPEMYHRNMHSLFKELNDYQELLCSRNYRLMQYVEKPTLIIKLLRARMSRLLKGDSRG